MLKELNGLNKLNKENDAEISLLGIHEVSSLYYG
jgi:hypothetical protein